jgi:hypothetical protein
MNLDRARKIVPLDATLTATSTPNRYGGAWIVWAEYETIIEDDAGNFDSIVEGRVVTQFAEPFSAARWINAWYDAL